MVVNDSHRAAFLFNKNAKSVTAFLKTNDAKIIPKKDLYLSSDLQEARQNIKKIIDNGYAYVFCGGGDGTAVFVINELNKLSKKIPENQIPQIGVLKLGTGNALANVLNAHAPKEDITHIINGKKLKPLLVSMVETKEGKLAPFAGIGYDGEIMNDFESIKKIFFNSPLRKVFSSVLGFGIAGAFKTLPRHLKKTKNTIVLKSNFEAYRIVKTKRADEEIFIPAGKVLYEGDSPFICVGSIPYIGYGFKLFPFASKRPGYIHLRVFNVPLLVGISNIYPALWHGYFRHAKLYDFLVRDVEITSQMPLPYQFAGDAMGYKKSLYFKTSENPCCLTSVNWEERKYNLPSKPLMMPIV